MNKKLLDRFFKENKPMGDLPTAPSLAHFHITLDRNPEANEAIRNLLDQEALKLGSERKAEAAKERVEIEMAVTCDQVIRIMRRHTDPLNHHILVDKAVAFEEEIVPEILKRLKSSLNEVFIEISIRVLAKSEKDIADELISYFDDMHYPYAQSMALVALGFIADETHVPWLIEKYDELKNQYPNESYSDGAYYALYEMDSRFYPVGNSRK